MRRSMVLVLLALLVTGIIIAAGCSSDKSTNNTTQPDPEAAAFVESSVAQSLADGAAQSVLQTLELFDFPVTAPNRPSVGPGQASDSSDFDSVVYTYTGGNHIFHFVISETESVGMDSLITSTIRGDDTVTIWNNNVGQQDRDSTTDSIRARLYVTVEISGLGLDLSASRYHVVQVNGNPWFDPSFSVEGNLTDSSDIAFSNDSGTCTLSLNSTGDVTDVALDSGVIYADECPTSGSIGFDAGLSLSCQGNGGLTELNVNGSWGIDVSWDGVVQTIHLTHNGVDYTSTDSCGTDQGIGKLNPWRWVNR